MVFPGPRLECMPVVTWWFHLPRLPFPRGMAKDGYSAGFALSVPLLFLVCGLCSSQMGIYETEETQWNHQCEEDAEVPSTLPLPLLFS